MRALVLLAVLLAAASCAKADTASLTLGTIAIDYDPARWQAVAAPAGSPEDFVRFQCLGDGCLRDRSRPTHVRIRRIEDGTAPAGEIDDLRPNRDVVPLWETFQTERVYGSVVVTGYLVSSRCRNYVPTMIHATARHAGARYVLVSGFNAGCAGFKGVGQERFEELLAGLRAV